MSAIRALVTGQLLQTSGAPAPAPGSLGALVEVTEPLQLRFQ